MDSDEATRVRQGASETTSQDVLRALATDPSVTVRASLALNPALPDDVIAVLASDTDARVRTILSRKLAALTPALQHDARQRVQNDAVAQPDDPGRGSRPAGARQYRRIDPRHAGRPARHHPAARPRSRGDGV